jgi:UDP-N-acetylmuramoyl-tripeptide--D-alanyl-D-alanine ligase
VPVLGLALDRLGRPSFTLRTAGASAPVALPLVGAHQALNASAAAAAGLAAGVPLDVAAAALATASLSKWRMELRDLAGGATLLNDSASRADVVAAVGEAPRPIADGAGERPVALADNDAAVDWLRGHLAADELVLVKASRGARLDEVAAALA